MLYREVKISLRIDKPVEELAALTRKYNRMLRTTRLKKSLRGLMGSTVSAAASIVAASYLACPCLWSLGLVIHEIANPTEGILANTASITRELIYGSCAYLSKWTSELLESGQPRSKASCAVGTGHRTTSTKNMELISWSPQQHKAEPYEPHAACSAAESEESSDDDSDSEASQQSSEESTSAGT